MTRQSADILLMRLVLASAFGGLFLIPIGIWVLLNLYYGWVPDEATVFGLDLRTVLICISGFGLVMLLLAFLVPIGDKRRGN